MLALLAACLWLAGCSGDGPDGGSGNLNIVFDCSMPLQVVAGETCEVGYTLEGASENARVRLSLRTAIGFRSSKRITGRGKSLSICPMLRRTSGLS